MSATLPGEIIEMTHKFMTEPLKVLVKRDELTLEVRCLGAPRRGPALDTLFPSSLILEHMPMAAVWQGICSCMDALHQPQMSRVPGACPGGSAA